MFDYKKPTTQMLGRWQPWHDGHTELFRRAHAQTGQVCIMIRDVQGWGEDNPFSIETVKNNIIDGLGKSGYEYNEDYIILVVPNIVDISYGRGVGYSITQHNLGEEMHLISATKIRQSMRENGML